MDNIIEINFLDIEEDNKYIQEITKVIEKCFEEENLKSSNLYVSIILTNPENIRKFNKQYRNIDKPTDVLSFPMFEKEEIEKIKQKDNIVQDVLGDIIMSIEQVKNQAQE